MTNNVDQLDVNTLKLPVLVCTPGYHKVRCPSMDLKCRSFGTLLGPHIVLSVLQTSFILWTVAMHVHDILWFNASTLHGARMLWP